MNSASSVAAAAFSNGTINQLQPADLAAHRWYRFVLSYPPHLVRAYLEKFGVGPQQRVLDPFCGTGTTVVECKKLGLPSVGVEANAMAWFASHTKTDWSPDPAALHQSAIAIADATQQALAEAGDTWRKLPPDSEKVILRNSISPLPLHKTLVLLEQIQQAPAGASHREHLRLALAHALVNGISNLHFGPEVGVRKPKADAPVLELWLAAVQAIAVDLAQLQAQRSIPATVQQGDSRAIVAHLPPQSIDAIITSPPYPNEKDYTRTTRLESVILGFIRDRRELRSLKQGLLRSNTRNVYKADQDDRWVNQHPEIQRLAREIEERRIALDKTSGFERLYHRAVLLYFGGMAKHLADLRHSLRPGAQLAYVVGDQKSYLQVMIRTGELLGDIATGLGYELVSIDLFRTRLATAIKEQIREEVVVLRWPGSWPTAPYPFSSEPL